MRLVTKPGSKFRMVQLCEAINENEYLYARAADVEETTADDYPCRFCGGSGRDDYAPGEPISSVRCEECKGTGISTDCLACAGTGVDGFAGSAGEPCDGCKGTGHAGGGRPLGGKNDE